MLPLFIALVGLLILSLVEGIFFAFVTYHRSRAMREMYRIAMGLVQDENASETDIQKAFLLINIINTQTQMEVTLISRTSALYILLQTVAAFLAIVIAIYNLKVAV